MDGAQREFVGLRARVEIANDPSLPGVVVLNLALAVNHRPGRYMAVVPATC
jgi:hypothetical protein